MTCIFPVIFRNELIYRTQICSKAFEGTVDRSPYTKANNSKKEQKKNTQQKTPGQWVTWRKMVLALTLQFACYLNVTVLIMMMIIITVMKMMIIIITTTTNLISRAQFDTSGILKGLYIIIKKQIYYWNMSMDIHEQSYSSTQVYTK